LQTKDPQRVEGGDNEGEEKPLHQNLRTRSSRKASGEDIEEKKTKKKIPTHNVSKQKCLKGKEGALRRAIKGSKPRIRGSNNNHGTPKPSNGTACAGRKEKREKRTT